MPRAELDTWAKLAALKMHEVVLITRCSYLRWRFTLAHLWKDFRRGLISNVSRDLLDQFWSGRSGRGSSNLCTRTVSNQKENFSPPITCKITVTANQNLSQV